ncbi:MAG: hypothetical protein II193_01345 [Lachnospiraceae bacterium]|nr:hypothetical protein [Lachnospiraceae bacterium]
MNLKYYFRGLGIGIIVTAVLMGVSNRNAVKEAKAETAKLYEYQEESSIIEETSAIAASSDEAESETVPVLVRDDETESEIASAIDDALKTEKETETVKNEETEETVKESSEDIIETDTKSDESEKIEEKDNTSVKESEDSQTVIEAGDSIKIEIVKGDDSGTASRKLKNAGIIENAAEYDAFLMQHGYDRKLCTGTKTINSNDTWQQIAEKLISK